MPIFPGGGIQWANELTLQHHLPSEGAGPVTGPGGPPAWGQLIPRQAGGVSQRHTHS